MKPLTILIIILAVVALAVAVYYINVEDNLDATSSATTVSKTSSAAVDTVEGAAVP